MHVCLNIYCDFASEIYDEAEKTSPHFLLLLWCSKQVLCGNLKLRFCKGKKRKKRENVGLINELLVNSDRGNDEICDFLCL